MKSWQVDAVVGAIYGSVKALKATIPAPIIGEELLLPYYHERRSLIFAFWHHRAFFMPLMYKGPEKPYVLVSQSKDGEIASRICNRFGFDTVRGSSTRGGSEALKECIRLAREGAVLGITPDGPKGPTCEVQPGVLAIARLAGIPIFPLSFSSSGYWELRSWDKFRIPKPFSRGVFLVGEPLWIPQDSTTEELEYYRELLTARLNTQARLADDLVAGT